MGEVVPFAHPVVPKQDPNSRVALVDGDEAGAYLALHQVADEDEVSILWTGFDYRHGMAVGRAKAKLLGVAFIDFTDPFGPTNGAA